MPDAVLIRRAWWLVAAASLVFGLWRSVQPDALVDFHRVMQWTGQLAAGVSPYAGDSETDYPPWALLTLAPMLVVPATYQAWGWIAINAGLAVAAAALLARRADEPWAVRLGLVALLLSTSPFRVLGQFSLLSFVLALWGAGHRSPSFGGVLLGLALLKPQVGGALVLAHLLLRDWRRVGTALLVPGVLTLAAGAILAIGPHQLLGDYARTLGVVHGGTEAFGGHTDLETWLAPLVPAVATLAGSAVVALVLLSPVLWRFRRGVPPDVARLDLYAWCGVVSLLATRHLSYDLLLVLPVLVQWRTWPFSVASTGTGSRWVWGLTTALLVLQVPGWWRRVLEPMGWPAAGLHLTELDRVLCLCLYALLTWRMMRLNVTK